MKEAPCKKISGQTYTTTTGYNAKGELTGYTYPDGKAVGRSYTARGEFYQLSHAGKTIDTRVYDNGGRMTSSKRLSRSLVAIYRAPGSEQQTEIINASEISKSLREWQIGGQAYNAELSWNRVSDVVVSGSIPYNRRDGNVFLIVPNAFPELTLQLSGLRDEFELDQCLDELDARLKEK